MDGSKPLTNSKWEAFALMVAGGATPVDAYRETYPTANGSAYNSSARLNKKDDIRIRIDYIKSKSANEAVVDIAYVIKGFKNVAERCQQAQPVMVSDGEGGLTESGEYKFDSSGANKALDSLAKHVGAYKKDHEDAGEAIANSLADAAALYASRIRQDG